MVGEDGVLSVNPYTFENTIPIKLQKVAILLEEVARMILRDGLFIGFTELRILARLYEGSDASISDLSRDLLVDKAWISRQLRQLARRGLVMKGPHPSDSRITLASLTPDGRTFFEGMNAAVAPFYGSIVEGVEEAKAAAMLDTLERNVRGILGNFQE